MGASPKPANVHVRRQMESMRTSDTGPEMALRRELHRRGLRFRLHRKIEFDRRRSIDIVFPREKLAVFVDGCFWHYCADHAVLPKNNAEFWQAKLETNRARDRDTGDRLNELGWTVIRVWEHEDPANAANRVERALKDQLRTRVPVRDGM